MSPEVLESALGQLPAYRAFAEALAREAVEGRHVLVLTGGQVEPAVLRPGLEAALARCQGPMLRHVPLAECGEGEAPAAFLARMTGLPEESLHPAGASAEGSDWTAVYDALWLEGLGQLPAGRAAQWLEYFRLCVRYARPASHVLVLPVRRQTGPLAELSPDTRLGVYHWWGRLSVLDVRMLCRLGEQEPVGSVEAVWREAVLPHLADGSATLTARLWEVVLGPEAELLEVLREHARQRMEIGALREAYRALGRQRPERAQAEAPPPVWRLLWELGAAQSSAEYGPELTAAALALLDEVAAVRYRLWRGQAALLLPRLTQLRMALCQELTDRHGRSWPLRFGAPYMDEEQKRRVEEEPLATEFGPLEFILQWRQDAGGQRYLPLVQRGRGMRNQLAHSQPVAFGDFKALVEQQQALGLAGV
jgi:hypothetical protein